MNPDKKAFINGKIYTVHVKQPVANAVVTSGNKIIYTGNNSGAKKFIDGKTEIIDLNGRLCSRDLLTGIPTSSTEGFT